MDVLSYILGKQAGGGGGEAVLVNKNISANGTYNASSDSADGYKKVVVDVPASAVDSGTKNITSNGNGQDVVGYAAVDVAVPNSYSAGDEGKVVSSGTLVSQSSDTVTANDTYDTTLINSLTVNVSGGGGTLPKLLKHIEYTFASDAYTGNRQSVNLDPVDRYIVFVLADEMPTPDASHATALSWCKFNLGSSATIAKGSIVRTDGTIGTDENEIGFTPSSGLLEMGGQYGYFFTGATYQIYEFECE